MKSKKSIQKLGKSLTENQKRKTFGGTDEPVIDKRKLKKM